MLGGGEVSAVRARWRALFDRLNQVEVVFEDDEAARPAVARWVAARLRPAIPARLRLPPDPGAADAGRCGACRRPLDRARPLVACTACLAVLHPECDRGGPSCRPHRH